MAETPEKGKPPRGSGATSRDETTQWQFLRKSRDVVPDIDFEMPDNPLLALKQQLKGDQPGTSTPHAQSGGGEKQTEGQGASDQC